MTKLYWVLFLTGVSGRFFECIQCGWYGQALMHAEEYYKFSKENYECFRYTSGICEELLRGAEKDVEDYGTWLSNLQAGIYDRLDREL